MAETHKHPESGEEIVGERLSPNTPLEEGDVYDSTDGKWRTHAVSPGNRVPIGDHVIWIRPSKAVSPAADVIQGRT